MKGLRSTRVLVLISFLLLCALTAPALGDTGDNPTNIDLSTLFGFFQFPTETPPTQPGDDPETELENRILSESERLELFSRLAEINLRASSGAGAWEGKMKVDPAGGFEGYYYDEDDEEVTEVSFSGAFGTVFQTGKTVY